ncbi:MbcA/ParS/Xre antitoxin family protein [Azonexus sp.]|uniref:MbcA/ParS/Xre antitoxin family protein n=1 Tax=Azonexus sp. TaxID=1872668 RepID=UPI0035B1E79D
MPTEITYLEVRCDAESHARRFGAKRDSAGRWYVIGTIPNELLNYLPRKAGRRKEEVVPECPLCHAEMRKAIGRSGNLYWYCVERNQTGCRGTIDYLKHLEQAVSLPTLGELASELVESFESERLASQAEKPGTTQGTHPLAKQWLDITKLAFSVIGTEKQVMLWLTQPKLSLGNQTPIRKLGTEEGCEEVKHLLNDLWN